MIDSYVRIAQRRCQQLRLWTVGQHDSEYEIRQEVEGSSHVSNLKYWPGTWPAGLTETITPQTGQSVYEKRFEQATSEI
jgi:hypothetical protein